MTTLTDYRGLRVLDPAPSGAGGLAIQNNLQALADRVAASRYVEGLRLEFGGASTVRVGPGAALSEDGSMNLAVTSPLFASFSSFAVGGLDAGHETPSTLYYVHIIGDSTGVNRVAVVLSASPSPTLPAGYDRFRRIGFVVNDARSDLIPFRQSGQGLTRRVHYATSADTTEVLRNGRATSFTPVTCANFAPSSCRLIVFRARLRNNDSAGMSSARHARMRCTGDHDDGSLHALRNGVGSNHGIISQLEVPCSVARSVDYRVTHADAFLSLSVAAVDDEL